MLRCCEVKLDNRTGKEETPRGDTRLPTELEGGVIVRLGTVDGANPCQVTRWMEMLPPTWYAARNKLWALFVRRCPTVPVSPRRSCR